MVGLPSGISHAPGVNGENGDAEASTSKVTLEDLRWRKIESVEGDVRQLKTDHAAELRDFFVLYEHLKMSNQTNGVTKIPWDMPEEGSLSPFYPEAFKKFYADHQLRPENEKSTIASIKIASSVGLRKRLLAAAAAAAAVSPSGGSENGKGPTSATKTKFSAAKSVAESKVTKVANTAVSSAAESEVSSQPPGAIVKELPPVLRRKSATKLWIPSSTIEAPSQVDAIGKPFAAARSTAATAEVIIGSPALSHSESEGVTTTQTSTSMSDAVPTPSSLPAPPSSHPPTTLPATVAASASVTALANNADQDVSLTTPASLRLIATIEPAPMPPTLRKLAPNPYSVTYASSLRPLPSDPYRRYTGCGLGGGAIHHRLRKGQPVTQPKAASGVSTGPAGGGSQIDLWRWFVRSRASPGAGLVGKSDKCLLTKDWKVAYNEQRYLKAMDRIEKLKADGIWTFRQPKKQKGPAVRKSHWDYLLEEMKWMQTDFREERRWKMAIARQLAQSCRAWHKAQTPAIRAALCIKLRPLRPLEISEDVPIKEENMVDGQPGDAAETVGPSFKQVSKTDPESVRAVSEHVNQIGRATEIADTVGAASPREVAPEAGAEGLGADVADADADAEGDDDDADGEVDVEGDADQGETAAVATGTSAHGQAERDDKARVHIVRESLAEQAMPQLSGVADGFAAAFPLKRKRAGDETDMGVVNMAMRSSAARDETLALEPSDGLPMGLVTTLRAPIFSMDVSATVVTPSFLLDSFDADAAAEMLGMDPKELQDILVANPDLSFSALFPELPEYGPPSEQEVDKAERRWDDGSLNQLPRLTQVSRLLDAKPILVSTLEPSKNRTQGRWREDGEWALAAKLADPTKGVSRQELDAPILPATTIFSRRSNKPSREVVSSLPNFVVQPRDPEIRCAQMLWSSEEDTFLTKLFQQYGSNWSLIADVFNSTRLSVPTDIKEAWDCFDRWDKITKAAALGQPPPPPPQLPPVNPPAGADKQDAGSDAGAPANATTPTQSAAPPAASLAAKREKLTRKLVTKFDGSRKRMRHSNIMEVMRKTAKRRESSKGALPSAGEPRKVNLASHETHNTVKGGPAPTAQQLSQIKAERDEAQQRQYQMMYNRRLEEQQKIAAAQAQAQQQALQASQQQQQSSQAQPQGNTAQSAIQQQTPANQTGQQQQQNGPGVPPNAPQRGPPMTQGRPSQMAMPRPAPGRTGTPSNLQQQQGAATSANVNMNVATQQRMTPQQQAQFGAQIRPGVPNQQHQQQYNPANAAGNANGRPPATTGSGAPGNPQQQQQPNAIGALSSMNLQQIQQALTANLAQNLTQEQVQALALQLFRNAQQQQQQQQQQGNFNGMSPAQRSVGPGAGVSGPGQGQGQGRPRPQMVVNRPQQQQQQQGQNANQQAQSNGGAGGAPKVGGAASGGVNGGNNNR